MARTKKPIGEKCDWTPDDRGEFYYTDCHNEFVVNDGTPAENKISYPREVLIEMSQRAESLCVLHRRMEP